MGYRMIYKVAVELIFFIALTFSFNKDCNAFNVNVPQDSLLIVPDSLALSPQEIVQKQLEAYNAKDINTFLSCYSDNIRAYNFPDTEIFAGKKMMRAGYEVLFNDNPNLFCKVSQRMVMNNMVVDYEHITGLASGKTVSAIAIFMIEKGKIKKVYFLKN
ncbi:MAG: nuclear transport factor 2 family protein [Bacteroidota bacterium]|nr:nuclear transport factor 2 family protein [Bacteroidota bacterium]